MNFRDISILVIALLISIPSYAAKIPSTNVPTSLKDKLAVSANHSVRIDSQGHLWVVGDNNVGQLGVQDKKTLLRWTKVPLVEGKKEVRFTKIKTGYDFSLALDTQGNLWGTGSNDSRQLGIRGIKGEKEHKLYPSWKKILIYQEETKGEIKQIKPTFKYINVGFYAISFAIDQEGNLWGTGSNKFFQFGNGKRVNQDYWIKLKVHENKKPVRFQALTSGALHSLALDQEGNLWGTGFDLFHQLGTKQFKIINDLNVLKLAFLLSDPEEYAEDRILKHWVKIPILEQGKALKFKSIGTSVTHSLALSFDGSVWATGGEQIDLIRDHSTIKNLLKDWLKDEFNVNYRIGLGTGHNQSGWTKVLATKKVDSISLSYGSSLVITNKCKIWGTGYNLQGQLASGNKKNLQVWKQVISIKKRKRKECVISALGSKHTLFMNQKGIWGVGQNQFNQLGFNSAKSDVLLPTQ